MLNPGDTQVTEMKLKPFTLEIKDLILDKKFNTLKREIALNYFKFLLIIIFIFFGTFVLVDYLVEGS
jgi:phospholipid-translocating ATPase